MTVHYATYSKPLRAALWAVDHFLALRGAPKSASTAVPAAPVRILVCNQAHLGDAILATAIIPALRAAYPQAEIGFLVNPGSRPVVDANPQIRWVHAVEHWHLIRGDVSIAKRIRRHRTSHRAVLRDIRAVGYQLAIDLHPYFPNSIPLLRQSGIECLVGWNSAGFGQWLDLAATDDGTPINALDRHARILALMGIVIDAASLRPQLHLSEHGIAGWQRQVRRFGINEGFVGAHIGAHAAHRRWPAAQWAEVVADLGGRGHQVVLMGHGADEVELGRAIAAACPQAIDLCGQLGWDELLAAIAASGVLLSHDSAAAHLAAAFDRPRVCIATGIHDLRVWLRASQHSVVLSQPVACAPCGQISGCESMACLRGVAGQAVTEAAIRLLEPLRPDGQRPVARMMS
ncbi:MAG: glycosyltransferase family 9 protein [Ideonella sp.]